MSRKKPCSKKRDELRTWKGLLKKGSLTSNLDSIRKRRKGIIHLQWGSANQNSHTKTLLIVFIQISLLKSEIDCGWIPRILNLIARENSGEIQGLRNAHSSQHFKLSERGDLTKRLYIRCQPLTVFRSTLLGCIK
jgi:hypothetical protein